MKAEMQSLENDYNDLNQKNELLRKEKYRVENRLKNLESEEERKRKEGLIVET